MLMKLKINFWNVRESMLLISVFVSDPFFAVERLT